MQTIIPKERIIIVGLLKHGDSYDKLTEYLDELELLVETSGGITIKRVYQTLVNTNPKTYIGKGKIEEIKTFIDNNDISSVVFDDELTPTQLRNIEDVLQVKILDRNSLILDIFAQRARTANAKVQVELAQYQYLLPRLTRMWTHLERQRGGIGFRGPGETQIETDRRIILTKIAKLKEELKSIDKQMTQQRKQRRFIKRAALVGYTNVGKSTLMNLLCKTELLAEDKLFATLDTTVRKIVINDMPLLLSDTVGFIRKLPHNLIEAFKSTLDEARESDLIIHVADISNPSFLEQVDVVNQTLKDLKLENKPTLLVFNKIDKICIDDDDFINEKKSKIDILNESYFAKNAYPSIFISAKNLDNVNLLKTYIYEILSKN